MATIPAKMNIDETGVLQVSWALITEADTGAPALIAQWPHKTVQVYGDFTTSGAITIEGSADNSNWATLNDDLPTPVALVITTTAPRNIRENTLYIRPRATAGTAVAMNVLITGTK